jgi:hypothetical protein
MSLRRFFSSNHLRSDFDRSSLHSGRPPTYSSNLTPAPAYSGVFNRVRAWSANIPSTSFLSSADSTTVLDETESSFAETLSVAGTSAGPTSPAGPRYSKRPFTHPSLRSYPFNLGRILPCLYRIRIYPLEGIHEYRRPLPRASQSPVGDTAPHDFVCP